MPVTNSDASCEAFDFELFLSRPNRSLRRNSRLMWLALIAGSTISSAIAAAVIGAWMVLPFAGLEVLFVWVAFGVLARHDGDYEVLTVKGRNFCWEQCDAGRIQQISGNRLWARAVMQSSGSGLELFLRYGGREVQMGRFMTAGQRERLSLEIKKYFQREIVSV